MRVFKLIKRWINMLLGKSVHHVKQGVGKHYSKTEVKGYYNDLTEKVSEKTKLDENGIPISTTITGLNAYFPIAIFQYALGLYDLYLETNDKDYLNRFLKIADWAVKNVDECGMWDCMGTLNDSKHLTQSSMCQSEGVSVLLRAHIETKDKKYLNIANKAINFMIKSTLDGGTCLYDGNIVIFQEYVSLEFNLSVLNGWIFSIFGLYDYVIYTKNDKYEKLLNSTVNTLAKELNKYDRNYWSNYDQKGTIASPAYHDLHIKQLELLFDLFNKKEFKIYSTKWKKYQTNRIYKLIAMFTKLKQKVFKNKYYDINTSVV